MGDQLFSDVSGHRVCSAWMSAAQPDGWDPSTLPPGQLCPRAGRDGELSSPQDLLEDVAATAPDVYSDGQHHHGEIPGFQQQLAWSALASRRAGPWLCPPPASPVVLLPRLPTLGKGFPHSACGYREKARPREHHRSLQRQLWSQKDHLCPSLQLLAVPAPADAISCSGTVPCSAR